MYSLIYFRKTKLDRKQPDRKLSWLEAYLISKNKLEELIRMFKKILRTGFEV